MSDFYRYAYVVILIMYIEFQYQENCLFISDCLDTYIIYECSMHALQVFIIQFIYFNFNFKLNIHRNLYNVVTQN